MPRIALIGRQNVGKSTLINRLVGGRDAIAHEMPGVTRDRVERETEWRGRRLSLVDTGGYVRAAKGIERLVGEQARRAMDEADVILFVVDAQTGPTDEDLELARGLRKVTSPVLVVVNKIDDGDGPSLASVFLRLGLGEPVAVSAAQGRGTGDLLDRVLALVPEDRGSVEASDERPSFALVGRPNVGKSSLFNRLLGEERSVVFEQAGTTRDAVDAIARIGEREVRFVDTAGLRRSSTARGVDFYSFLRTERAIERSDVACLVFDAAEGLTTEDRRIAARVMEMGRGIVLVANKWDLVEDKDATFRALNREAERFCHARVIRTSARTGVGILRLPDALLQTFARFASRASTSRITRLIERAQGERPGPVRYRYAAQVSSSPPTFVLFGGREPSQTYERYLENRLRAALDLEGVPIRLRFRAKRERSAGRSGG